MQTDLEQCSLIAQMSGLVAMRMLAYRAERNRRDGLDYATMTTAQADRAMSELLQHTIEEVVELLMCVNRKPWKPLPSLRGDSADSSGLKQQALMEFADVTLMLDAFRDAAGFTQLEVLNAIDQKMQYNLQRQDHSCNQTISQEALNWLDSELPMTVPNCLPTA